MLNGLWYSYVQMALLLILMFSDLWLHFLIYGKSRAVLLEVSHKYNTSTEIIGCICIFTFVYCLLKAFITNRKIIVALILQAALMFTVWLYIVYNQDLNFKIVTIDWYMILGWTASLYCLPFYFVRKCIFRMLKNHPKSLRNIRIAFNLLMIFIPIIMIIVKLLWLLSILMMTILQILHYCGNLEERSVISLNLSYCLRMKTALCMQM